MCDLGAKVVGERPMGIQAFVEFGVGHVLLGELVIPVADA